MKLSAQHVKRFLVAASVALAVPLTASAFGPHGGHAGRAGAHGACVGAGAASFGDTLPHHLRALNLSEAQRDRIFDITHAQAPALRDKAKALRQAEGELRALAASPDYNDAQAKVLADRAAAAMSEMTLARIQAERQVNEVLTPEQRQQLADIKPRGPRAPRGGQAPSGPAGTPPAASGAR